MPTYTNQQVTQRASSGGKDAGRKAYADNLFVRAQAGDQNALQELTWRSGVAPDPNPNDKEGSWATADARNYGKMLLGQIAPGYTPEYDKANDGSFKLGKALGGVVKVAAPIAGMAIPGLGTLGALAIGGLGNTAGNLMQGRGFDLKGALLSGAGAAAGNALLGNQGFKGIGGIPQRLGFGGNAAGNATQAGVSAAGGGGGLSEAINKLGGLGTIAKVGVAGAGLLDSRAQRAAAQRMADAQLKLRQQQLGMAEQDYAARAPLRNAAISRLDSLAKNLNNSVYGG